MPRDTYAPDSAILWPTAGSAARSCWPTAIRSAGRPSATRISSWTSPEEPCVATGSPDSSDARAAARRHRSSCGVGAWPQVPTSPITPGRMLVPSRPKPISASRRWVILSMSAVRTHSGWKGSASGPVAATTATRLPALIRASVAALRPTPIPVRSTTRLSSSSSRSPASSRETLDSSSSRRRGSDGTRTGQRRSISRCSCGSTGPSIAETGTVPVTVRSTPIASRGVIESEVTSPLGVECKKSPEILPKALGPRRLD